MAFSQRSVPLHQAVYDGDAHKVNKRIKAGDDLEAPARVHKDGATGSALCLAVMQKHKHICKILLAAGSNPSATTVPGAVSALQVAVSHGDFEMAKMLVDAGAIIDHIDDKGGNPALHMAAMMRDVRILKLLIDAGAAIELADPRGSTALWFATQEGSEDCVRLLLEAGADPSNSNKEGSTPLHIGSAVDPVTHAGRQSESFQGSEHAKIVPLFLQTPGVDPNVRNRRGLTPLMVSRHVPVCRALLEGGASATTTDPMGNGVLHYAGDKGRNSGVICTLYKSGGANPILRNLFGETPADLARKQGHHAAAQLLEMLATEYRAKEASVRPAGVPCEGPADGELVDKMKAVTVSSSGSGDEEKMPAEPETKHSGEEAEVPPQSAQVKKARKRHRGLQPCLHCQTLTHRRCARCRTAYMCSLDCQMATMAEHKTLCLQIHEERERTKAECETKDEDEA